VAEAIDPRDLVPMDIFPGEPIEIDVVYADSAHPENIFGVAVYEKNARMILHKDLARVVLLTARFLHEQHGWTLILKDGLRPVEAQEGLMETDIVKRNPQWLEDPGRLLSDPGQGAHPRGMAIDVSVKDVDMGTVFDEMTAQSARDYTGFEGAILENRKGLEAAFADAAAKLGLPLLALPSEWWDFRFPAEYSGRFAPLHNSGLPPPLRICKPAEPDAAWDDHFDSLAKSIPLSL
jgi:D-alanyl-D-alanine dipeptidase